MDKLFTQPLGIHAGVTYFNSIKVSRMVSLVSLRSDKVEFFETSNGVKLFKICSVMDFLEWMET